MTTLRDIAKKTGVGLWTLRKLHKAGFLKADDDDAATEKIRLTLARGNPLSVAQLVELIEDPSIEGDLGRYADRARAQVAALGNVKADAAPLNVCAYIDEASNGNVAAISVIAAWVRQVVPPAGAVNHGWIASRLVWNSPSRDEDLARVSLALIAARKELDGWFYVDSNGSRSKTFYARPKKGVAKFDL